MTLESLLAATRLLSITWNTLGALEAGEGVQIVPGRRFPGDSERTVQRGHTACTVVTVPELPEAVDTLDPVSLQPAWEEACP